MVPLDNTKTSIRRKESLTATLLVEIGAKPLQNRSLGGVDPIVVILIAFPNLARNTRFDDGDGEL